MEFSPEQQTSFDKYIAGKNIFITGPGGTGKSALIRHIQKDAYMKCIDIQVCALTGTAAVLLECKAKTVHSWAGIGLGNGSVENLVKKILKTPYLKSSWRQTEVLIIDEVSMMSQRLFELLDGIGKAVRKNSKPFGGIRLIFSGDFYQLPPVGNKEEPETMRFCFESPLWFETFKLEDHVSLTKIFRQNDPIYQRILNQIREGQLKRSSNELLLESVGRKVSEELSIKPTKLFPTRNQVDYINASEMNKLISTEYTYKIKYHADGEMTPAERVIRMNYTQHQIETELLYLQGNLRCDETVKLKVGAQVMCIVNIKSPPPSNDILLCNGSQGVVKDISPDGFPIVSYTNGIEMTMRYNLWMSELIPGVGVSQIPLILAWALTIHKSQGSTLDVAEVDAGSGIFECGQTYVALSRVKSLEGLYLTSFDAKRVRINKKVQGFYERLYEYQLEKEEEMSNREVVECLPEAYVETTHIPIAEVVPMTNVTPLTKTVRISEYNIDFSRFANT